MHKRLLILAFAAAFMAGCKASVDESGHVVTDRVWFDQAGKAHCPECMPTPKLSPTADETADSLVLPHRAACEKKHSIRWGNDEVVCWKCQGGRLCPHCKGTGLVGKDLPCPDCIGTGDEGAATSSGLCGECGGRGLIRYGGVGGSPYEDVSAGPQ